MTPEEQLYRSAIRRTVVVLVILAVVGAAVAWALAGVAGAVAALVGVAVAALGAIPTQVSMLVAHRKPPHVMAGIVAFSWLGKMALIIIALLVLRGIEGFEREAFAATAVAGIVASLVVDVLTLRKARIPYVNPGT